MKRVLFGVVALGWAAAIFLVTLYLTFPSQAFVDRIRADAPGVLGKEYSVDLDSVSPWWVGLSAHDIKVFHTPRRPRNDEEAGPALVAIAKDARLRVGVFSLLAREPYLSGKVTLADGTVRYEVGTEMPDGGDQLVVQTLQLDASDFPLADLMVFLPAGTEFDAVGTFDLSVDLQGGKEGMKDAEGDIRLQGSDIVLTNVVVPNVGPLGFDVPISEIDLSFDVDEGKAQVETGRLVSELLTVEIEGDLTLREPLDRTSVNLELVVSDLGQQFQAFSMMMTDAKHADGKYHYQCRGLVSRLSSCPVPLRERSSRTSSIPRSIRDRAVTPKEPRSDGSDPEFQNTETDDERAKRRDEIRERLRQRREEREAEVRGDLPTRGDDDEFDEEDDEFIDEEFEDEFDEEGEAFDEEFED